MSYETDLRLRHLSIFDAFAEACATVDTLRAENARLAEEVIALKSAWDGSSKSGELLAKQNVSLEAALDVAEKALEGYRDALCDGPENCTYLKYEEVDAIAESAIASCRAARGKAGVDAAKENQGGAKTP